MARANVTFRVRAFTKEIICDAENEEQFQDYLDNHSEEYENSLVERVETDIEDAQYDEPDKEAEPADDESDKEIPS